MILGYFSLIFGLFFLLALIVLHFLKREINASTSLITDYKLGEYGWLMQAAFFSFAVSLLFALIAMWPTLFSGGGAISRWLFLVIVLSLIGVGVFKAESLNQRNQNLYDQLESLCGAIVVFAFPLAASLAVSSLVTNPFWAPAKGWLIVGVVLCWLGLLAYVGNLLSTRVKRLTTSLAFLARIGKGWLNRLNGLTYLFWLLVVALSAIKYL